ncbi:MAG TPA: glycosyltransferase family 2 protein [Thermoanaerobaculia bacterium]|jgi:glycosyltransferase involved in cell wall biosynthesis
MKLIVQIPAFNEEKMIAQTLRDIPKRVEGFSAVETLVIDDGSSDKTADAARKAGATHLVQLRNHRGLSAAFVAGIDAALRLGADVIVNTDADNQYAAADIAKLVAPIVKGSAEVVIGDREVSKSPHMSAFKKSLQRLGSWTVGKASGVNIADVTSGFRAFSREAAMQINVFNPFTYTLETIIQSGNRNLGVQTVAVKTNAPTRESRLYRGVGTYLRKSIATIFRIYTLYKPLKTFFAIGAILMLAGLALGVRFLWAFAEGDRAGHIQSLILCAVFLVTGFQTWLIALLADLIAVNRRLSEEVLIRVKKLESPERRPQQQPQRPRQERPERPQQPRPQSQPQPQAQPSQPRATAKPATQWVWLMDDEKEKQTETETEAPPPPAEEAAPSQQQAPNGRRRRRRRGGVRHAENLPGNRGKHLDGDADNGGGE